MIRALFIVLLICIIFVGLTIFFCAEALPTEDEAEGRVPVPPPTPEQTCTHKFAVPVVLNTEEIVSFLCGDCGAALPSNWGCTECEWADVRSTAGHLFKFCTTLCREHRR